MENIQIINNKVEIIQRKSFIPHLQKKIGIIGVDNYASSLLQGTIYYQSKKYNDASGIWIDR
jgi:hypothetical protein